jgi:two-component system, cell cycle response regulator
LGGRKTLLVVDDAAMFRELESVFLARCGRVLEAASGADALDIVRREPVDLVVLDLHLPDIDGALVCKEICTAKATAHTPVIVVTGPSAADHARAIRAGAWDVLAKPLSRSALLESALRFLEGPTPRGLPRAEVRAPVRIVAEGREAWGVVRNVSRGGLFIEADRVPAGGSELRLEFALPGTPAYAPSARVVWQRLSADAPPGMGVRFVELDRESAGGLDAFVHERGEGARATATLRAQPGRAR